MAPLLDDGTLKFAAIDLDEPDFEAARLMQSFLPGPSWLERSRSGNAHVWVFFSDWTPAWIPRGILKEAIMAAGKAHVEIFPKQDALMEGMLGNYINLPYHGLDRPVLQDDDTPWPPSVFIDLALDKLNDPEHWVRRAEWLQIIAPEDRLKDRADFGTQSQLHICAEHIIANRDENPVLEGYRNEVYFSLSKMLLNYEGFDEDECWGLIQLVNDASPDRMVESELRRIFNNVKSRGFTSTGCDGPLMGMYTHPDCPIARRA